VPQVFLNASGPKLPSWCTRSSTAVHRRTFWPVHLRCRPSKSQRTSIFLLVQPPVPRSTVGSQAFSVAGP